MTRALKEAMEESADQAPPGGELNIMMANRIMTAVAAGERDLDVLKRAALSALSSAASPRPSGQRRASALRCCWPASLPRRNPRRSRRLAPVGVNKRRSNKQ